MTAAQADLARPGQLTAYPILRLPEPIDVVAYVRIVEEIIINVLAGLGIKGERVEGRSGVWILGDGVTQDKKIAALGMRVSRNTTMHGFAINCCNDLAPFAQFIPCGISDAGVTTISEQLGRTVTPRRYFGAAGGGASEVSGPSGGVLRARRGAGLNTGAWTPELGTAERR